MYDYVSPLTKAISSKLSSKVLSYSFLHSQTFFKLGYTKFFFLHPTENTSQFRFLIISYLSRLESLISSSFYLIVLQNCFCGPLCLAGRLPMWLGSKESACQCRTHRSSGFNPWVRKILWRRKWQSTSVFLPGKSHGQESLVSPWGHKELDMTEWLSTQACLHASSFLAA